MHAVAYLPSPTRSAVYLGAFPIRFYALCIVAGIIVAVWLTLRRWRERGGNPEDIWDISGWAIVFGIIGGRLYHVITDPELYFDKGRDPWQAFKIWDGGLGIWGAVALGAVGAWIGCRRKNVRLLCFADAAVPGVLFAQGIGRWGNWFNNELYGGPTSLPWRLKIYDMDIETGHAVTNAAGHPIVLGYFQPTFLYESIWDIAIAFGLLYVDRRLRLGRGNLAALYVMGYTAGRGWIEALRHDHANHFLGLRLNDWTAIIMFLVGLAWFLTHGGFHAQREPTLYTGQRAIDDLADRDAAAADQGSDTVRSGSPPEPQPGPANAGETPRGTATE